MYIGLDNIDIAGRSSARICRALTFALARLSCLHLRRFVGFDTVECFN